jgi:hypothetical protein
MKIACLNCGGSTEVIDSRPTPGCVCKRRRKCQDCGHRITTVELVVDAHKHSFREGDAYVILMQHQIDELLKTIGSLAFQLKLAIVNGERQTLPLKQGNVPCHE